MNPLFALALELRSEGLSATKRDLAGLDRQGKMLAASFRLVGAALAGIGFAAIFRRAVSEAGDAERAMASLEQAVKNTDGNFAELSVAAETAADQLQRMTRFSDDAAIGALAKLTAITNDGAKALRNLGLASDIAAFKGIALEQGAEIVGRVLMGNNRILKEFGINVKDGGDVMQQLRDKFSGFAEKEGATFQGRLQQVRNAFLDVLEALGRVITDSDTGADMMVKLRDKLAELSQFIDANAEKWKAWAKDSLKAISDWYDGFLERQKNVAHWFNVIAASANSAVAAMRVFLTRGGDPAAWKNLIDQQKELNRVMSERMFEDVTAGGSSSTAPQVLPGVTIRGTRTRDTAKGSPTKEKVDDEKKALIMLRELRDSAHEMLLRAANRDDEADFFRIEREFARKRDEIAKLKVSEQTKTDLLLAATAERGAAQQKLDSEIWERIRKQREEQAERDRDILKRQIEEQKRIFEGYATALADVIINSVTDAFSELFQGKGITASLKALGKGILSGLGFILVQIGKQVIAASAIVQAAVAALLSLNPIAALAAGIALVALGSMLGGSGGGSVGRAGSYATTSPTRTEDITRLKFVNRDGSVAGNLTPRPNYNIVIIGANDPAVNRQFAQMLENHNRR